MSGNSSIRNVGGYVTLRPGAKQTSVTAAGAGDNTSINGPSVDLSAIGYPRSLVLGTFAWATQASGNTLTLTSKIQDSADNSSWSDFATEAAAVLITGQSGGGELSATHELPVDLSGARRYVRAVNLPDLSAAGTDTALIDAAICFGGAQELAAAT